MKPVMVLLLLIPVAFAVPHVTLHASHPSGYRPLDLPSGGGFDDDEEPAPHLISFYGQQYEGDAFFFCLDKSGSMAGPALTALKSEVIRTIRTLSTTNEFSLVAFSSNVITWRQQPTRATGTEKRDATRWVSGLVAAGSTCLTPATIQTLEIARLSSRVRRSVIVVSDGFPFCNGTDTRDQALENISSANDQQIPVHTIFIGTDEPGYEFLRALAHVNRGTFAQVLP